MAGAYNNIISRATTGSDPLVPEEVSSQVIQELPKASAALSLMAKTILGSKTYRMPVLDVLPVAFWLNGDTGLKQTTDMGWRNITLIVEELAAIVPIPEAYLADADIPIWDQVRPRMVSAIGKLIDLATIWGVNKPSTWGTDIYTAAVASGNVIKDGFLDAGGTEAAADLGQTVAALGDAMSQTGYVVNGFAGRPGLNWRLMGMRSAQGAPIYQPNMQDSSSGALYGAPIFMPQNGSWDQTKAQVIVGDWDKSIIGVRQDMTFKIFTEGVISDDSGNVVLNLMQNDSIAMRVVMRLAYATVNPVTEMQPSETMDGAGGTVMRFPFGVVAS
jgi:HK97 family phage major capsid protein